MTDERRLVNVTHVRTDVVQVEVEDLIELAGMREELLRNISDGEPVEIDDLPVTFMPLSEEEEQEAGMLAGDIEPLIPVDLLDNLLLRGNSIENGLTIQFDFFEDES